MADKQVFIDNVRMVYANFPKSVPVRMRVIRSIGDALFERRLRNFGAYKAFKAESARMAAAAARKANKADQKAKAKMAVGGAQESRQAGTKKNPLHTPGQLLLVPVMEINDFHVIVANSLHKTHLRAYHPPILSH
ncbi:hypothetical protein ACJ73_06870 [Blastomyces percursus]|uniref:Uncharacterized protein n=1 Tax=Blastomyces percursus TaxID=1658174 RepID=A0A1J9PZL3_9EURO|nr:hypothetical protein ACJ73_06870 [Blastomyces percursus]